MVTLDTDPKMWIEKKGKTKFCLYLRLHRIIINSFQTLLSVLLSFKYYLWIKIRLTTKLHMTLLRNKITFKLFGMWTICNVLFFFLWTFKHFADYRFIQTENNVLFYIIQLNRVYIGK